MADTRVLRWRASLAVAAALVVGLWWLYSGGPGYVIQIDYQWIGEFADGAEVVIDGAVVDTLSWDPRGRPVRGYSVEAGEHVVDIRTERCESRPETVQVEASRINILLADFEDRMSGCYLFFR